MGLDGWQVLVVFMALIISFFIFKPLPILILIITAVLLTKINKELKKGNPSPVESYLLKDKTTRQLVDNTNVLKTIHLNGLNKHQE